MSEPEFDMDAAEQQYEDQRAADPALDPAAIEVDEGELDPKDAPPPGFKSYDDYISEGGDPDRYVGKTAFADNYDRIQDNKRLRGEIKGLNTTVQQTMDAMNPWQDQERTKMRGELESELRVARENEDLDGALDAQKKIDQHDATPKPKTQDQPREEHSVIQDFRDLNPLLDQEHDDFNEDFNNDVEAFYNETAQRLTVNGKKALSDPQIKRALNKALRDAKELHTDLFESPRNTRRTPGGNRQQRRQPQKEAQPTAEQFVIDDPRNPSQRNAATDIRETIRDAAVKAATKAGKSADDATKAGDTAAQKFERSLHRK